MGALAPVDLAEQGKTLVTIGGVGEFNRPSNTLVAANEKSPGPLEGAGDLESKQPVL